MENFIKNLQFIFKPSYWLMNEPYNSDLDLFINELLDKHEFENVRNCTAILGGITMWIANIPYSCMMPYENMIKPNIRPSRLTIQKGLRKLKKVKNRVDDREEIEYIKRLRAKTNP